MGIKICSICKTYNLTDKCRKCGNICLDVGYKFKRIKDAPKDSAKYFLNKRNAENN